ncbi:MAG: F0F1 ATP synthase subunit A [Bacteroidota bacterium]
MRQADSIFKLLFSAIFILTLLFSLSSIELYGNTNSEEYMSVAPQSDEHGSENELDVGEVIIGHILDSYDWHIASYGNTHITIPLPIILIYENEFYFFFSNKFNHGHDAYKGFKIAEDEPNKGKIVKVLEDGRTRDQNASFLIDLSITKNALSLMIGAFLLCFIMIKVAKVYKKIGNTKAPSGLAGFIEPIVFFVRNDIAKAAIGEKNYERFLPYLLTLFFFLFINNIMGLIPIFPGGANSTGNIAVTFVLAMFTFITMQISSNKTYWKHIYNTPGVPMWLKFPIPLMPIIEILGIIVKPIPLMLRLFANITAGHMIILGFLSLIFVLGQASAGLGWGISILTVIFVTFMNFLELLVAFLQAYIFTIFTAVFFGFAVPEDHH